MFNTLVSASITLLRPAIIPAFAHKCSGTTHTSEPSYLSAASGDEQHKP